MTSVAATRTTFQPAASQGALIPLIGRVLLAAIFIVSALGKIADPAGTIGYITSVGLPAPSAGYALALIVELVGGLMILAGYRTRAAALVLAGFSVASALIFHHAIGDQNQLFHFLKNLAMAGGLLQVAAFGAGSISIDARRRA
jgi:putative oxidoreductase